MFVFVSGWSNTELSTGSGQPALTQRGVCGGPDSQVRARMNRSSPWESEFESERGHHLPNALRSELDKVDCSQIKSSRSAVMPRSEFLPHVAASAGPSTSRTPPPDDRRSTPQPNKSPSKPPPNFSPPKRKHIVSVKGKEREHELAGGEGSSSVHGLIGAGGGPVTWRHWSTDKVGPA